MWKLKGVGRYIIRIPFLYFFCCYLGQKYIYIQVSFLKNGIAPLGGLKEQSIQTAVLFAFVGHSCITGKKKVNLVN